ncbi:MAG: toll/interleukin-1 receptor domain-containing protein [Aureispira sp.]
MNQPPKVFLSYSTEYPKHQAWVIDLCNQLIENGIDATLDVYDLQPGQDMYVFMERIAHNEFDKIVIISNSSYARRANARKGGVGVETQLLTSQIYTNIKQQRIIPIYTERDSNHHPILPFFLESRYALDFSEETNYEEQYKRLYLAILGKPEYSKPPLGAMLDPEQLQTQNQLKSNNKQNNKNIVEKDISNVGNVHIGDNKPPKDEIFHNKNIVKGNINNAGDIRIGDNYG